MSDDALSAEITDFEAESMKKSGHESRWRTGAYSNADQPNGCDIETAALAAGTVRPCDRPPSFSALHVYHTR